MKKFILIALVLVIATAFAFAAFQAPTAGGVALEAPQTVSVLDQTALYAKRRLEFLTWRTRVWKLDFVYSLTPRIGVRPHINSF